MEFYLFCKNKFNKSENILFNDLISMQIKEPLEEKKLSNSIKIIDFLENPFPLLKKSDVFILSSNFEGLPNVLMEAQSLKLAIISSKCPTGPREILDSGKGGLLFKSKNHKELAKKIICLLYTSPSPRDQRGSGIAG